MTKKLSAEITGPIVSQLPEALIAETHKAKKQLAVLAERKYNGPLVDCFKSQKVILGYLAEFAPREWNNIPIPLQELSMHLISYDQLNAKATNMINKSQFELTSITQSMFMYSEQSLEEIRDQVSHKFSLLNQRSTGDSQELKSSMKQYADKIKETVLETAKDLVKQGVDNLRAELRSVIDDKHRT